ncbi:MAG: ribonuclease H-like domain-containing protein, partial [Chloroflexota bacterium]
MTDLRSKLLRLGYKPKGSTDTDASERNGSGSTVDVSGNHFAFLRTRRSPYTIDRVLPGERVSTPYGDCFMVEHHHPPGHPHGVYRLDEALEVDPKTFSWMARNSNMAGFDLSRSVFVDLETTGLAGGTGTYAFLVGIGYYQGVRFVVRQFFMEDYDAEEALLHALAESLEPFGSVVTFNGKSFDLPLLETRFQLARRPFPLQDLPHLDLLYPARRLWKGRLESCALSSLEESILGVER